MDQFSKDERLNNHNELQQNNNPDNNEGSNLGNNTDNNQGGNERKQNYTNHNGYTGIDLDNSNHMSSNHMSPNSMGSNNMSLNNVNPNNMGSNNMNPNNMNLNQMGPNNMSPDNMNPNYMEPNSKSLNNMSSNIGPNNLSPNNMSPNNMSPNNMSSNNMSPNNMSPNHMSPNNMSPYMSPNNMSPNNMSPNHMSSNNMSPNHMGPNHMSYNNRNPNHMNPNNMNSGHMYVDNRYPGNQGQYMNNYRKPRLQIIHENPAINDFDQVSMKPKSLLSWTFFSLFILAVVVLGVSNLIHIAIKTMQPELADSDWYNWVVTFISLVLFGLPIFYLLLKRIPDSPKGKVQPLKLSTFIVIFFICAASMYITNMFSVMIVFMLSIIKGEDIINPLNEVMLNGNFLITMVYAAFIAPIVEEVIFRGLLLSKLRRYGDIPAILLSGLAFGCFHFNLSQFFYAAVLGFIFAYVTIRTNTIKYSIILHVMINFIASAVTPLVAGGNIFAAMALSGWVFASIIIGIVFFFLSIKKIRLEKGTKILSGSSYFLNTGVILYTAISIAMIVVSIVIS